MFRNDLRIRPDNPRFRNDVLNPGPALGGPGRTRRTGGTWASYRPAAPAAVPITPERAAAPPPPPGTLPSGPLPLPARARVCGKLGRPPGPARRADTQPRSVRRRLPRRGPSWTPGAPGHRRAAAAVLRSGGISPPHGAQGPPAGQHSWRTPCLRVAMPDHCRSDASKPGTEGNSTGHDYHGTGSTAAGTRDSDARD
jgi:hypothetical protein